MSQAEYDAINHTSENHDCEADQSKCGGDVRYTCDSTFHWLEAENCADSGKACQMNDSTATCVALNCNLNAKHCNGETLEVCREVNGVLKFIPESCETAGDICVDSDGDAHCAPRTQVPACTEGTVDCDTDGNKKTCTSGRWETSRCPDDQKCVKRGDPEIAKCVDAKCAADPEQCGDTPGPVTGNASVNISIKNTSSNAITIVPYFRFVLSTEGTGSEHPYNRTDRAIFAEDTSITIDSGATKFYQNIEIPGDSKQYIGQHFAKESELNGYANNVLLYDTDDNSETIVPEMINPSTLFTDGGTYEIIYSSNKPEPPTPGEEDIVINLTIRNSSASAVVLGGDIVFVLANPDKNGQYHGWEGPYNRTDHYYFSETAVTLNAGTEQTFNHVDAPGLGGRNPLSEDLLPQAQRNTNVLLYNTEGESGIINPQNLSPDIIFTNNGSYTIVIP